MLLAEACAFKGAQAWHVAEVVFVPVLNDTWLFREIAPSKGLPKLNAQLKRKAATAMAKTPQVLDSSWRLAFPKCHTTQVSGLKKCATRCSHVEVVKVICPLTRSLTPCPLSIAWLMVFICFHCCWKVLIGKAHLAVSPQPHLSVSPLQ